MNAVVAETTPPRAMWSNDAVRIPVFCAAIALATAAVCASACGGASNARSSVAPVLLYTGTGTSPNDVVAVKDVLAARGLSFETANTTEFNALDTARLRTYRLLIIPGGNFVEMSRSFEPATTAAVREAVQDGLNYLGICAGGLLAGHSDLNDFDLASGTKFGFYAAARDGTRKAAVPVAVRGMDTLDYYWEDGPEFTGWGTPIGTYPDGTPAIVEGASGQGWVVLTGVHPEAPESWRRGMAFRTPASATHALAATLVDAALNRRSLASP